MSIKKFFTRGTRFKAAKETTRPHVAARKALTDTVPERISEHLVEGASAILANDAAVQVLELLRAEAMREFSTSPPGVGHAYLRELAHQKLQAVDFIIARLGAMRDSPQFETRSS